MGTIHARSTTPGPTGETGSAATITVGTSTALSPGATPTVSNSGSSSAAVFNFGIPQGVQGPVGATGSTFGSVLFFVLSLASGSTASPSFFVPSAGTLGANTVGLAGSMTISSFTSGNLVATLPISSLYPSNQVGMPVVLFDSTSSTYNVGLLSISTAGAMSVFGAITTGHAAKVFLDGLMFRIS